MADPLQNGDLNDEMKQQDAIKTEGQPQGLTQKDSEKAATRANEKVSKLQEVVTNTYNFIMLCLLT